MTEKEEVTIDKFCRFIEKHNPSNEFLVKLFELTGYFLNIQTIPDYCRNTGISYPGAKKCRDVKVIHGVKWIIDNN